MSHTGSALLSRPQYTIAVAGATGKLGKVITSTLLGSFRPFFPHVLALTRDTSSSTSRQLASEGAELVAAPGADLGGSDSLAEKLKGVDIVVNALGATDGTPDKALSSAAAKAGVMVYFPTEFGVDHNVNDFPGFDHPAWEKKKALASYAREQSKGKMRVIQVYTGLFLEDSVNPRFGFDVPERVVTAYAPSTRVAFSAKADIGRAIAQLAILAMLPDSAVPDHVRIAGTNVSPLDLQAILSKVYPGEGEFKLVTEDVVKAKEILRKEIQAGNIGMPAGHIRIIMGEGKLDFSDSGAYPSSNELVNPGQRLWLWATFEDHFAAEGK